MNKTPEGWPPVDDYAAKIWSGLIRDYYLPRWEHFIQSRLSDKNPDMGAWEEKWVRSTGVSAAHAPGDLVNACRQAIREAPPLPSSLKRKAAGSIIRDGIHGMELSGLARFFR